MPRPLFTMAGSLLAGAGLLAGIASLAVPWGRYRVRGTVLDGRPAPESAPLAVFQVPGGTWYLLALALLAGLLAIAALDTGRAAAPRASQRRVTSSSAAYAEILPCT